MSKNEKELVYLNKREMQKIVGGFACNYVASMECIVYISDYNYGGYLNGSICDGCAAKRIGTKPGGGGGSIDIPIGG